MRVMIRILEYLSFLVSILGIYMFVGLILSPANDVGDGFSSRLLAYGCSLKSGSIYFFISAIILLLWGLSLNYSRQKKADDDSVKDRLVRIFRLKNLPIKERFLVALSNLLLVVFLFSRLSVMWNHCA